MVKCFVKPIVSASVMGILVFVVYKLLSTFVGNTLSTLISILIGVLVYGVMIILTKSLDREDLASLPMGGKLCALLERFSLI
jgi:stage V sporulation protein B